MSKIVLVTGASSGYGKATAKVFADKGYTVVIAARNKEKLDAAKNETGADASIVMDVTKPEDWNAVKKFITEKYGRLDILVNNAGGGVAIKEVSELSVEEIDSTIKLNLNSVIYGCREFADMMRQQKFLKITLKRIQMSLKLMSILINIKEKILLVFMLKVFKIS